MTPNLKTNSLASSEDPDEMLHNALVLIIYCKERLVKLIKLQTNLVTCTFVIVCLFDLILYVPVNNLALTLGRVFLG